MSATATLCVYTTPLHYSIVVAGVYNRRQYSSSCSRYIDIATAVVVLYYYYILPLLSLFYIQATSITTTAAALLFKPRCRCHQ